MNKQQDNTTSLNVRYPTMYILARIQLYTIFWVLFLFVFVLFNEFSLSIGNYTRTSLFEYHSIAGVHVSIVEITGLCFLFLIITINLLNGKAKARKLAIPIVVFAITILIASIITGLYRLENRTLVGMAELKALLLLITFCIVSCAIFSTGNTKLIIYLPAVLLCVRMLYEIVKYFYFPYVDNEIGRITKVPNLALVYLPVLLAYRLCHSSKFQKVFFGLLVLLISMVTVLSKSRSSTFIAFVSSIMVIMYIAFKFHRRRLSLLKFHIISMLALVVIVLPISFPLYRHSAFVRSFHFWNPKDIPHAHTNLAHYHDIQRGIKLIKCKPILGYGLGGELPKFKTAVFPGLIHNELLHFWVTFGFLGMVLWAYTFILLPFKSFKAFDLLRKNSVLKPEYFVLFTLFPYAFTKILVSPPFYFGVKTIFFVAVILAIQFNLIREAKQLTRVNISCKKS